jgi:uncharacterized protein YqgC (DUF456 family)
MEGLLEASRDVAHWGGTILWALAVVVSGLTILVSLPGGWVALALVVGWDALHGFEAVGWPRLVLFAALLGLGELVEALLGTLYVAKKGATRWGVVGTFVGGIAGAIVGSGIVPVVGTLIGTFAGAYAGAVAGELIAAKKLEPSLQVGMHATAGRLLAVGTKGLLAGIGIAVSLVAAFGWLARGGGA